MNRKDLLAIYTSTLLLWTGTGVSFVREGSLDIWLTRLLFIGALVFTIWSIGALIAYRRDRVFWRGQNRDIQAQAQRGLTDGIRVVNPTVASRMLIPESEYLSKSSRTP